VLASTRADHTRFYLGLGFRQASEPRVIPGWPVPGILVILDWMSLRCWIRSHRRYYKITRGQQANHAVA
jgi:hypothetical protein